ncbi:circadian clock protein KaiC [Chitinispirillales bacterium ANBcel5]|uniref:circadian clock protein KaiC n=1 Tax=Cellulosispirillum alkaliphilum TaxID=3039283 RepID=UPI002A504B7A|nr:circadian clock protein KaiC [Chitinispirillales bacterium ANBcel5]
MSKGKTDRKTPPKREPKKLQKTPTGITGFDEITRGGLPQGRPCLVAGKAGSGKTLFGMEFLARGAMEFNEPGMLMSFEERTEDLVRNFASLGFDLQDLMDKDKLSIDYVFVERSEIEETGEYSLDGLFVRLAYGIEQVKAKRVVLDTIEALFSGLTNEAVLRAELRRLFYWLKEKGVTAVITGERGTDTITRHGLEEYVADCVILLDHTVDERIATRRMRVVKYRGSAHGTDEYPFLIDEEGISVLPVTSLQLEHQVSTQKISSGVQRLDTMLGGQGFFYGSSILVSGTSGTGKSTLAASFAESGCESGKNVLYFAFEESPSQIIRNMKLLDIDLQKYIKKGNLKIESARPTVWGLELHLASMHKAINEHKPDMVIVDPISNLISVGSLNEVKSMLVRLIDYIKGLNITAMFTDLIHGGKQHEATEAGVSSLMDTWILLKTIELNGERNRGIYVLKARGINHSNQIREFLITPKGIDIIDVYTGRDGVLTGSARVSQEAKENAENLKRKQKIESLQKKIERKDQMLQNQIKLLKAEAETEKELLIKEIEEMKQREKILSMERKNIASKRRADI